MAIYRPSHGERVFDMCNLLVLGIFALLALIPFLYTITMSLSTQADSMKNGLHIIPHHVTWTSYMMVFKNPAILVGYANTIFRTVVGTAATVIATCIAAFPLSRKRLPLRSAFIFVILFTMLFGGGLVPTFLLITKLGLYDNRLVFIIPGLLSAMNIIIVKNFFQSIPEDLYESAMLDGASDWTILWRIYMPLSKPVLATIALWIAVGHWNSWFDAMLYTSSDANQVLQGFLQRIVIYSNTSMISQGILHPNQMMFTSESIKSAIIIVTILPILLLYPFIQKFFIKGIMLGSVKE